MEGRGNRTSERRSGKWIAAAYSVLLMLDLCAQQVASLSACHDPPQVIRISRGQKITVEYWVGQNSLETGAGQQPWKPEAAITTTAQPDATATVTASASGGGEDATESSTTAAPLSERAPTTSTSVPPPPPPPPPITEKIPRQPSSSTYPPATASVATKVNETGTAILSPKTNSPALDGEQRPLATEDIAAEEATESVTSRSPSADDQNINEQEKEQESSSISAGQSESSTSGPGQSELSTRSAGQLELSTAADIKSELSTRAAGQSESSTSASDQTETSTARPISNSSTAKVTSPQEISARDDEFDVTVVAESEVQEDVSSSSDGRRHEARDLSTEYSSPDYRHHQGSSASDDGLTEIAYWAVTTEPSTGEDNLVESRNADDEIDANLTSTAAPSNDASETIADLSTDGPSILTLRAANETSANNTESTTEGREEKAVEETSSTATLAEDSESSDSSITNSSLRIDDEAITGRSNTENILSEERATEEEIESTTAVVVDDNPEALKGKSVLESISTTIRAILSTLAPTTTQEEEFISGRNENISSSDHPITADINEASPETEEPPRNVTVDKRNRGSGDELEGSSDAVTTKLVVELNDNQNSTDSSAIIFEEVSNDPSITINPRDPEARGEEEPTTVVSGRAASVTAASQEESTTDDGGDTTDVVIILDLQDEEGLTEKSVPQQEVDKNSTERIVTESTPELQTEQKDEDDVTDLRQVTGSGRPAEGARKFENTEVSINGGEETGFRVGGSVHRKRTRKPFVGRNRKPHFVRHRPPYVTLDGAGSGRPPFFLRQAPPADRPAYTVDETPVAADRVDPASQVVLMDENFDPLLEDASSDGTTYYAAAPFQDQEPQMRADFFPPPESRVHYVNVMRPPDGVLPVRDLRMTHPTGKSHRRRILLQNRTKRSPENATTDCQWVFRSDPGVPLLLTFKSFSTPETTDCRDHYISVERESNGFQSRWCGASGDRPGHAAFARSEINLQLFSVGDGSFPTGFSVEIQALDLKLLRKYAEVRRIIKGK